MASFDGTPIVINLRLKPAPLFGFRKWIATQLMRLAMRIYSGRIGTIEIAEGD